MWGPGFRPPEQPCCRECRTPQRATASEGTLAGKAQQNTPDASCRSFSSFASLSRVAQSEHQLSWRVAISLEGVVLEVRPASMETRLQHVVGIHTQGIYSYNCLFHLSKCTTTLWSTRTTTVPTLWRKSAHLWLLCGRGPSLVPMLPVAGPSPDLLPTGAGVPGNSSRLFRSGCPLALYPLDIAVDTTTTHN